jgi:Vitamin K-dependent gamma-carboxylase
MRARAHLREARRAIERFAFAPARGEPLAALRIGLASVLLGQAAMIAPSYREFYGRGGLLRGPLQDLLARPGLPHLGRLIRLLAPLGVGEGTILALGSGLYVLSLVALALGLATRVAAALAWFLHLTLMTTGEGTNYGADQLSHVFLYYLVWAPSGATLSLDRALRRVRPGPSPWARLALRVVQLHLCIVYLTAGVAKAMSPGWRDGDAIWRVLMTPEYRRFGFDFSWLAGHPGLATAAGWAVVAVEIGYAALVWPRKTRRAWVLCAVGLHLAIAVFMGLTVFGAVMVVLTTTAFGVSADPGGGRRQPRGQ